MQTKEIKESKKTRITLEPDEAQTLNRLGRSLASKSVRPGFEHEEIDRRIIRCSPTNIEGQYDVRVSDAVGVIRVSSRLQIEVQPKIPMEHLVYLMTAARELPRMEEQQAQVDLGVNLLELIARWYVKAAGRLLRLGLIKDYSPRQDFLAAKRGRIDMTGTARAFYSGRIGFECEFDEFDTDTPLNRVIKEGASVVVRNPSLDPELRREAIQIRNRMDGLSPLESRDLRARIDRRGAHYKETLPLAKQLIRAEGRSLKGGARDTWSFLVRTPEMVEEGLRNILRQGLHPSWILKKNAGSRSAIGANLTFRPDLVFERGLAVGDVKYKLQRREWNRSDLNQIVAFVAAYRCQNGAVFNFRESELKRLPELGVGEQTIRSITWPISADITAEEAASSIVKDAALWLGTVTGEEIEEAVA